VEQGISGIKLARLWRCHPSTVTRVVRGQIKNKDWLNKLVKALKIDPSELYGGL
jgi:hypothetical protein